MELSSDHVAVNHLTGWTTGDWLMALAVVALMAVMVGSLVVAALNAAADDDDGVGWWALGILTLVVGLGVQGWFVWMIVRHSSEFRLTMLTALGAAGLTALVAYRTRSVLDAKQRWQTMPGWVPAVPAIGAGVVAVIAIVGDALTRAAASIPMAVGTLVGLVIFGVLWMFLNARAR